MIAKVMIGAACAGNLPRLIKKGTNQTKPFISGNPEISKEDSHIGASHIYWGFTEALKGYYKPLIKLHTGNINDYSGWIVLVLAIIFIIVGVS